RREERRLGVLRLVEELRRTCEREPRDRLLEREVGFGEHGCGGVGRADERLPHADGLRSLAGEDESGGGHRLQRSRRLAVHAGRRVRDCTQASRAGYPRLRESASVRPPMTVETRTGARRLGPPPPARAIARRFEADLSTTVLAAGTKISNVR